MYTRKAFDHIGSCLLYEPTHVAEYYGVAKHPFHGAVKMLCSIVTDENDSVSAGWPVKCYACTAQLNLSTIYATPT